MIRKDLLEFQYYLNRLSMFMKESYGMQEQFEIFYQQLLQVNNQFVYLFDQLDIFNTQDKELLDTWVSKLIDKIGAIFGCYRKFTIIINEKYEELNLDDYDFIIYIKCQIIKQNFKGTREELSYIYSTFDDGKVTKGLLDLVMVYVLYQTQVPLLLNSVQCNIYWSNYSQYSDNLRKLFLAGYLTIESMGILYNRITQNIDGLGIFASIVTLSDGDYYVMGGTTYYIWNNKTGWHESNTPGNGENKGTITDTAQLPNFGYFYCFAGEDGDYFKVTETGKWHYWSASTKTWVETSTEPGSGTNWGEVATMLDLPTTLEGGFFS